MDDVENAVEPSSKVLDAAGVSVMLVGTFAAGAAFLFAVGVKRRVLTAAYADFRRGLGRAILFGLEFLVGADIIGTVPSNRAFTNSVPLR